jgi:hypothetical protein
VRESTLRRLLGNPAGQETRHQARLRRRFCGRAATLRIPARPFARPEGVQRASARAKDLDYIHYFVRERTELAQRIATLKSRLKPSRMRWIAWPKKAAKLASDLTEDVIRALALANGLVDVKVCAVDATWSALKLVIPLKQR